MEIYPLPGSVRRLLSWCLYCGVTAPHLIQWWAKELLTLLRARVQLLSEQMIRRRFRGGCYRQAAAAAAGKARGKAGKGWKPLSAEHGTTPLKGVHPHCLS